jgi:hypothetical protein
LVGLAQGESSLGGQGSNFGLLTLPTLLVRRSRQAGSEPFLDYSKYILLTTDEYLMQMEHMCAKRTNVAKAKDAKKVAAEERKRKHEDDRNVQI